MNLNPVNQILIDREMTQIDLAKKLKVHRCHLNQVINGGVNSNILKHRIAKKLGKPINELWPNEGRAPRAKASP